MGEMRIKTYLYREELLAIRNCWSFHCCPDLWFWKLSIKK